MNEFQIRVSQKEGSVSVTVLHVSGDIDANNHQELDIKAAEVTGGGANHVLLDLSNSENMSSAGFRSMHKIHTALNGTGPDSACLKLLNPSEEVSRLMKAMGFDLQISEYHDLNEAINAF